MNEQNSENQLGVSLKCLPSRLTAAMQSCCCRFQIQRREVRHNNFLIHDLRQHTNELSTSLVQMIFYSQIENKERSYPPWKVTSSKIHPLAALSSQYLIEILRIFEQPQTSARTTRVLFYSWGGAIRNGAAQLLRKFLLMFDKTRTIVSKLKSLKYRRWIELPKARHW